uniref:Uncharacterized protein n=1 Tax=Glossina brevipalpis TaxID=37001 RepID=A0A1A9VZK6_9MUSC
MRRSRRISQSQGLLNILAVLMVETLNSCVPGLSILNFITFVQRTDDDDDDDDCVNAKNTLSEIQILPSGFIYEGTLRSIVFYYFVLCDAQHFPLDSPNHNESDIQLTQSLTGSKRDCQVVIYAIKRIITQRVHWRPILIEEKNLKLFVLISETTALINGEQGIGGEVMFLNDFFSGMNIFGLRYAFTGQDPEHFITLVEGHGEFSGSSITSRSLFIFFVNYFIQVEVFNNFNVGAFSKEGNTPSAAYANNQQQSTAKRKNLAERKHCSIDHDVEVIFISIPVEFRYRRPMKQLMKKPQTVFIDLRQGSS